MKAFIANLKFSHKFLLIGAMAAVMLAVPTGLIVKGDLDVIRVARREVAGLAPAGDVLKLIQLTQQHRGLSTLMLGGNDEQAAPRQAKQAEVEQALAKAQASAATLGDAGLAASAGKLGTDWQALASAVGGKAIAGPDSFARHTALIGAQLAMLDDIANASGINRHPEAAGYFLNVAVLQHLPRLTESLGQMRARGSLLLSRGNATPEEKARMTALAADMDERLRGARKALDLATATEPALKVALAAQIGSAVSAADDGLRLVDEKIVRAESLNFPAPEYFAATTKVIDAQFALMGGSFRALQGRLENAVATAQRQLALMGTGLAVLAAIALWTMAVVTRTTTASVRQALGLAEAVAGGDLSQRIDARGRDEMGQLLRALGKMNDNLARVVGTVRQNADGMVTASAQIASGNEDLSQRTEEQAANLQQTAASMEQMNATVRNNADTARQATELASGASAVASKGGAVVGQVVSTMQDIAASSSKIADIIGTIDGIAFQTNILALNAAVEAARAGDQGRGFAVVAGEVRTLAQRSAEAAKEIKRLIGASTAKVEAGSRLVGDAGATMQEIVGQVKRVADLLEEMSSASAEQTSGIGQVSDAVTQLDQVTQQNSALVEETAAAADSLKQQATRLVEAVSLFKLSASPAAA